MRKRIRQVCRVAIPAALAASWVLPQEPARIRVETEMVLIDLLAFDREGNFHRDLSFQDIRIFEDGQEQDLVHFRLVRKNAPAHQRPDSRQPEKKATRLEPFSAAGAQGEDVRLAIVIDFASLSPNSLGRLRDAVDSTIGEFAGAREQFLLAAVGNDFDIYQNFTSSREALLAGFDNLQGNLNTTRQPTFSELLDEIDREIERAEQGGMPYDALISIISSQARSFLTGLDRRLRRVSRNLQDFIWALGSLPGRKHVVFYTEGYPLQAEYAIRDFVTRRLGLASAGSRLSIGLASAAGGSPYRMVDEVVDAANRAQVSFYTIAPQGLEAANPVGDASMRGAFDSLRQGLGTQAAMADIAAPQEFLAALAGPTGGEAFLNNNNLVRGVRKALADASQYYVLGYVPDTEREPGKKHRIEVKLPDGIQARHREMYIEQTGHELYRRSVNAALAFPDWFADFPFKVNLKREGEELAVQTLIPVESLPRRPQGGLLGRIEIYGVLLDGSSNWTLDDKAFGKAYHLQFSSEELRALGDFENFTATARLQPPSKDYSLRIAVVLNDGEAMAAVEKRPSPDSATK